LESFHGFTVAALYERRKSEAGLALDRRS
jgi:hypothetical protein